MEGKKYTLMIFLVIVLTLFISANGAAEPQVTELDYGITISSNQTFYSCSPTCSAEFNVTNNGQTNGTFDNLTIRNNFSFDHKNLMIGLSYYDGGNDEWNFTGEEEGKTVMELTENVKGVPFRNQTDKNTYRFRINLSNDVSFGKWNFTAQLGVNNSTGDNLFENFTLDPYIQDFNKKHPKDGKVVDKTVNFRFGFNSSENKTMPCRVQANTSEEDLLNVTEDITSYNNSITEINESNLTKNLSHGKHKWRLWCDSDGDGEEDSGELSNFSYFRVDNRSPMILPKQPLDAANFSDKIEINVSVEDEYSDVESVYAVLDNDSEENYSLTGEKGGMTEIQLQDNESSYHIAESSENFSEGDYTLFINTSDGFGFQNITSYDITFDRTKPVVENLTVNATSSDEEVANYTHYFFEVNFSDNGEYDTGVEICNLYETNDEGIDIREKMDVFDGVANLSLDTTGWEGKFSFQVVCGDYAGNKEENSTLMMEEEGSDLSGNLTEYFYIDASGPSLVEGSMEPGNSSWVSGASNISFELEDYSGVDDESVNVFFNGSKYNSSNSTGNLSVNGTGGTVTVVLDNFSVDDEGDYEVNVSAEDISGNREENMSYNFSVDTQPPSMEEINKHGEEIEGWYNDEVKFETPCSDSGSGVERYSVEAIGDNKDNGDGMRLNSSNGTVNLTFAADDGFEGEFEVNISCTDSIGRTESKTEFVNIDNKPPEIDLDPRRGEDKEVSEGDTEEIEVTISDDGVGLLNHSDIWESLDVTYDDPDMDVEDLENSSEDGRFEIFWNVDVTLGTFEFSLVDGGSFTVEDKFDHGTNIEPWEVTWENDTETDDSEESSASSQQSIPDMEPELELKEISESIELDDDDSETLNIEVENTGKRFTDVEAEADVSGNEDISAEIDKKSFSLNSGEETEVELEVETGKTFSGSGTVDISFEYSEESVDMDLDVEKKSQESSVDVTGPGDFDVYRGNDSKIVFNVENTGEADLEKIGTDFNMFMENMTPEEFFLDTGESKEVAVWLDVPETADIGEYSYSFKLSSHEIEDSNNGKVKVQPVNGSVVENITESCRVLEKTVEEINNESLRTEYNSSIKDMSNAIESGDYARAYELRNEIESQMSAEQVDKVSERIEEEGGSGIWMWILVVFGGLVVSGGGFLGYVYFFETPELEDEEEGYSERALEEEEEKDVLEKVEAWFAGILTGLKEFLGINEDSETVETSEKDGSEKDRKKTRKKIKFDR